MSSACDDCLRRAHLVGFLAPWIADRLLKRERLGSSLLALPAAELIAAAAPKQKAAAHEFLERFDPDAAREAADRAGLSAVCLHAEAYPALVRDLPDRPPVLFSTAPVERLEAITAEPAVTIVGARRCSAYARDVAYELGRGLGAAGVTVVSGLALGIDAEAHRGAVDAGGSAIGVLAGGADVPYPRTNRRLYERIRRGGGAIVSEMPPGIRPFKWGFPARNRIMAALAQVVVIVEAAEKSGTMITAELALGLDREVCAVPGRITSRMAEGSNRLIKDGSAPVCGVEDLLDRLFGVGNGRPESPAERLEPELRLVLDAVENEAPLDEMAESTRLSAAELRAALGRLELLGLIVRDGVGSFRRAVGR